MRGILLTILSLGAAIVAPAKAQFVSIPDSNAVWVTDHYDGPNFLFGQHLWLEPWNRDTIIAGVSYSVLRDSSMGLVTSRFGGGLHDNGSGQVYYYDPFTSMPHLLYDFDVVVGDTLFSVYPSY